MKTDTPIVPKKFLPIFIMLASCFALWGLLNNMTDNLVPSFQKIFMTSQSTAGFVQISFYGAYSVIAILASLLVQRKGYRVGVLVGLGVYCIGALTYVPAALAQSFWTFIVGIFVVAGGCAVLETTCNPYVLALGDESTAVRRLNFAQMFNPVGSFMGIFLAQQLILANLNPATVAERRAMAPDALNAVVHHELFWVCVPYVSVCAVAAAIWVFFALSKPTEIDRVDAERTNVRDVLLILMRSPRWYCGVVAQVFYVGVQIAAWTWTNVYCRKELGVDEATAANYYLIAFSLFMVCRWICTWLMKWFEPARMMAVFALGAVLSSFGVMYLPSDVVFRIGSLPFSWNVISLCAMSGFMSLMFPTIYGIGLGGIDPRAHKLGAAGLIMAIVGGALLTPWMAAIIDKPGFWACLVPMFDATVDPNLHASSMSLRASFVVPAICFAVVGAYALAFSRGKRPSREGEGVPAKRGPGGRAAALLAVGLGVFLSADVLAGGVTLSFETDRIDGLYAAGETATVSLSARNEKGKMVRSGRFAVKVDNFGSAVVTNLTADFAAANPFRFRVTRPDAGFLRVQASNVLCGVGFDVGRIAPGTPYPDDFERFWREAIALYDREIPAAPETRVDEELSDATWIVERVAFAAPGGRKVYGYVTRERAATGRLPGRVEIAAAGYGSWSQAPTKARGRITLKMTVYPFEPDAKLGKKGEYEALCRDAHARWGVPGYSQGGLSESREAYFFYPVILANNRAIDWFAARADVDAAKIDYSGTSQGGGLGLAAMALNGHFARGCVFVPALTDLLGRNVGGRKSGWPSLVESHPAEARPAVERNAPYFCGVNFARLIRLPIRFCVGHVDNTCPPNAVYAAYNACPSADKDILGGIGMGHGVFGDYASYLDAWSRGLEIAQPQVRFLAFNIWGDYFRNPVEERAGDIVARVRKWNPDIAGFQEMTPRFWQSSLVTDLEKDYAFVGRGIGVAGHDVHTPILYRRARFDLVENGIVLQCPELDESKGAVWAVLTDKVTGRKLVAFASHAWYRYDGRGDDWIRLRGAKLLVEKMHELAKRHDAAVVGGGDLNAPLKSGSLKWLLSHGFADAQESAAISPRGFPTEHADPVRGPTGAYVGRNGANGHNRAGVRSRYLDHIFYDPERLSARRFDLDISPVACRISDHHPIILDFDFKSNRN